MLTISPAAATAIARVLSSPAIPDGATFRLSQGEEEESGSGIAVTLVETPEPGDDVVPTGWGDDIYLDPQTSELLEEQILDAQTLGQHVSFMLRRRALNGLPIGWG
jgi:hypothetical protein